MPLLCKTQGLRSVRASTLCTPLPQIDPEAPVNALCTHLVGDAELDGVVWIRAFELAEFDKERHVVDHSDRVALQRLIAGTAFIQYLPCRVQYFYAPAHRHQALYHFPTMQVRCKEHRILAVETVVGG